MPRPVFITSSPNTEEDDIALARKLRSSSSSSENINQFSTALKQTLSLGKDDEVYLFDSGRSGWYFLLKQLGIGADDEVILPAFTCLAVANPVAWVGAKPIYVDCEIDSFNLNPDLLAAKITPKTKAILVQHTFGRPADMQKIVEIIGNKPILLIEDCAHSLGGVWQGRKLGNWGDAAILGFGIDKVISAVRGGGIVMDFNKLHAKGYQIERDAVTQRYRDLPDFPRSMEQRALLNPIIWNWATPTYFWGLGSFTVGRLIIRLAFKLGLIGNVVDATENVGGKPNWMPAKIGSRLALLGLNQLQKLEKLNSHRREISAIYAQELGIAFDKSNQVFQKCSFLLPKEVDRKALYYHLRDRLRIVIGDWLPRPLYAKFSSTDVYQTLSFDPSENPVAVEIGKRIVNLPTSINTSPDRAQSLARAIKNKLKSF